MTARLRAAQAGLARGSAVSVADRPPARVHDPAGGHREAPGRGRAEAVNEPSSRVRAGAGRSVLVIGNASVDAIVSGVHENPRYGREAFGRALALSPGGVFTTAYFLAQLLPFALVHLWTGEMTTETLPISPPFPLPPNLAVRRSPFPGPTADLTVVFQNERDRGMLTVPLSNGPHSPYLEPVIVPPVEWVHMGAQTWIEAPDRLRGQLRRDVANRSVSLIPDAGVIDRLRPLMAARAITVVLCNEVEAALLVRRPRLRQADALAWMAATPGLDALIVTRGAQPVHCFYPGGRHLAIPVPRVKEHRRFVGLGDIFVAGYIAARVTDGDEQRAIRAGIHWSTTALRHLDFEAAIREGRPGAP